MKLLVIRFPDTVDDSHLLPEEDVTVTKDNVSISGKVLMSGLKMADPELIDGMFRITEMPE